MSQQEPSRIAASLRASWLPGLILLAVALALRLAYLQEHRGRPEFQAPLSDALYHHAWARALAFPGESPPRGTIDQAWDTRPFFKAPGYPYALGLFYRVAGDAPVRVALAQSLLGLVTVWLLVLLGRACGGASAGWWAGALGAGSWVLIYYEQELMEPVLLLPLLLGFLWQAHRAAERVSLGRAAAAGLLLGAAVLVRPNYLLFVPLAALWLGARFRAGGRSGVRAAAVLMLAALLATAPALLRNVRASGEWIWLSANGGINLYLGNNPHANGLDPASPDILSWSPFDYPGLVRRLETETGRTLGFREASRIFSERALAYWREQPAAALALTVRKMRYFWTGDEIANEADLAAVRAESRLLRRLPLPFAWAAGLGLVGVLLWWSVTTSAAADPRARAARALVVLTALLAAASFVSVVPFFAAARFRVPILPVLYLWAALGLTALPAFARREGAAALMPWAGMLVMVLGLVTVNRVPDRGMQRGPVDRALSLLRLGRTTEALQILEQQVAGQPGDFYARSQWGTALLIAGQPGEALAQFEQALERERDYSAAHLGRGQALARLGRLPEAAVAVERSLEIEPGRADGWTTLAAIEHGLGKTAEADGHFRRALQLEPSHVGAVVGLGYLQLQLGQAADAAASFRRALALQPDHAEAQEGLRRTQAAP